MADAPQGTNEATQEDMLSFLGKASKENAVSTWSGTFAEFLRLYETHKNEYKNIGALAHQRVYNMILSAGVEEVEFFGKKRKRYNFFEDKLFGIEDTVDEIMSYIHAAAQRTETSRRLLLMYGPPSSGKSEIVNLIKRGLEDYTQTKEGAIFALKDSKMHENPFLLVPHKYREEFGKRYGIRIEGDLSPHSRYRLENEYNGDFLQFPITQIFLSEASRVGIGTWLPSDSKCLSTDCLLFTPNGLVRGNDVFVDKSKVNLLGSDDKCTDIKNIFDNGVQPLYQLNLRGMTCEATSNHRFMTINSDGDFEWSEVKDMQGKIVPLKIGTELFGEDTKLRQLDESLYSEKHHKVECPDKMNPNLGRLAGYLISEGYCDDRQISFSNQNDDLNNDFSAIVEEEFKVYSTTYKRNVRRVVQDEDIPLTSRGVTISKQKFVDFINLNFETNNGACDKRVPKCVLASSRNSQIQFLEGLYLGDGHVHCRGTTAGVSLSSCSKKLITDVQVMLFNFGFYGCVSSYVDKKYPTNTQYRLTVEGCDAIELGKLLPKFTANRGVDWSMASEQGKSNYESFGSLNGLIKKIRESTTGTRDIIDRRYMIDTKNSRSPSRISLQKWLTHLQSKDCVWTKIENKDEICGVISKLLNHRCVPVTSVEYIGHKPVYDVEVSNKDHSFIVNGLISHNSQDVSELVGSINLAAIGDIGSDSDPRAYNFDGELNVANRGVMEFIEGLKADEKFLRSNLTATQEKAIKAPRFGLIYVDTFIIMHTNESEFIDFMKKEKYEAYHDRMVIVRAPYNTGVANEVKIYEKLLAGTDAIKDIAIAPNTLDAAAMFSVLSRLEPPQDDLTINKKMKLYDGQNVKGFKLNQVPDIKRKAKKEAMSGVSPRFINDQISLAISKCRDEGKNFITAIDVLRQLNKGVRNRDSFTDEEKNRYEEFIDIAKAEYNDILRNDIQKAFFLSFDDEAKVLFDNYINNVDAYCSHEQVVNPITMEKADPDEKLMNSIEDHIGISDSGRHDFRVEILNSVASAALKSKKFDYTRHAGLKEGIQKQLFEERKGAIRMTVSTRNPDPDALKRLNEVIDRMCDKQGYTPEAANELLSYASAHLFDK